MAKYERPSGAYTPTEHSVNITKYQDDSSAIPKVAISSAKVDGDINKLFDAVNILDGSIPDPAGNAGKYVYSDGTNASYATITASTIANTPAGNISSTNIQDAINELDSDKITSTRTITAGTGLTGGGDLSADRTLNVDVGTGAGQIVQLDSSARLPAVDGSQLTGLSGADTDLSNLTTTGNNKIIRAWVTFTPGATPTIDDSYNVSSINRVGSGQYIVNFTYAMANANYCIICTGQRKTGTTESIIVVDDATTPSTTSCGVRDTGVNDGNKIYVAIVGD